MVLCDATYESATKAISLYITTLLPYHFEKSTRKTIGYVTFMIGTTLFFAGFLLVLFCFEISLASVARLNLLGRHHNSKKLKNPHLPSMMETVLKKRRGAAVDNLLLKVSSPVSFFGDRPSGVVKSKPPNLTRLQKDVIKRIRLLVH